MTPEVIVVPATTSDHMPKKKRHGKKEQPLPSKKKVDHEQSTTSTGKKRRKAGSRPDPIGKNAPTSGGVLAQREHARATMQEWVIHDHQVRRHAVAGHVIRQENNLASLRRQLVELQRIQSIRHQLSDLQRLESGLLLSQASSRDFFPPLLKSVQVEPIDNSSILPILICL